MYSLVRGDFHICVVIMMKNLQQQLWFLNVFPKDLNEIGLKEIVF